MSGGTTDAVIFAILTTGAVLIMIQLARLLRASMQHKTIREAISRDNESVPALLAAAAGDDSQRPTGANDERTGMVLVALGAALFLYSLVQGSEDAVRNIGAAALFPLLVGAALLVRFYLARRRDRQG